MIDGEVSEDIGMRLGGVDNLMIEPNRLERKLDFVPRPSNVSSLIAESPSAFKVIAEE